MTTFAHINGGFVTDLQVAASQQELATRYHPDWLAAHPFVVVPDGTVAGAKDNGNGTFTNPASPLPQPVNPGNPYFGKKQLPTKDFYGLVGQILTAARYKRLTTDSHYLWVGDVLNHVTIVDTDDSGGQFLKIVAYLTATSGDDGSVLMTTAERDTIMAAWPVA